MPSRMSESRLFRLAAEYHAAHADEKAAKALKQNIAAKVLPVLAERGVKSLTGGGWKVTSVTQTYTKYDVDAARRVLTRNQFMAVTSRQIDPDKLAIALSEGIVTEGKVARFAERVPKVTYLSTAPVEDS